MATQKQIAISPVGTISGNSPELRAFPEAASQTFVAGEAVYLNGSGYLAEFTSAVDTGGQRFLGFAAEAGHNDASNGTYDIKVYIGNGDTIFRGAIYHGTAGSAVTAITDIDAKYPLQHDTTNSKCYPNKQNPAGPIDACTIVEICGGPGHAVGDQYGWVKFFIDEAARQYQA